MSDSTLRALTIRQPWAWAIAAGFKKVENRGWLPSYRGLVAIHSGLTVDHSSRGFPDSAAAEALGRPHRVDGVVVRGDMRGRTLGYPTANLRTDPHVAVPADGVYAGHVIRRGARLPAAISVGTNPTFDGRDRRVEAYILDFDTDIYGESIGVEFVRRLRPMTRFDSVEELVTAMDNDVRQVRDLLG